MNKNPAITIVLADDHAILRSGFRNILEKEFPAEINFVAEASNGTELINAVDTHQPRVVITDIQMPLLNGIEACKFIKQKYPSTAVLAFSMFSDKEHVVSMLQAGATGYLVKTSSFTEIIEAIRTVSEHKHYYCSTISEKVYGVLLNSNQRKSKQTALSFGTQEKKVMQLICKQYSTKEIAGEMSLSSKTVEHYREHLMEKIGARNVVGIALYAIVNEFVKFTDLL